MSLDEPGKPPRRDSSAEPICPGRVVPRDGTTPLREPRMVGLPIFLILPGPIAWRVARSGYFSPFDRIVACAL